MNTLSFDRTVPRSLVHRSTVTEVFITDSGRVDDERVLVAAQWPRDHALHHPDLEGYSDPVLLVETIRQAGIYLAHQHYDVPLTHRFIFCDLEFRIDDFAGFKVGGAPQTVVLDGGFVSAAVGSGRRFDARYDINVTVDGMPCAQAALRVLAVNDSLYAALRGTGAGAHLSRGARWPETRPGRVFPPAEVGRLRAENVILCQEPGGGPGVYRLCLTPSHPGYFEHPSDHIPGMALVEAFRQAAHRLIHHESTGSAAPGRMPPPTVLAAMSVAFESFGDLDEPLVITATEASPSEPARSVSPRRVELTAVQGLRTVAHAGLDYRLRDNTICAG